MEARKPGSPTGKRWKRVALILSVVAAAAVIGVYVGLGWLPPPEPWYELGSPGTVSNGGVPLFVGCNNTPLITGANWPSDAGQVTLTWYVGASSSHGQTEYPVHSGSFSGHAPSIEPTNVSSTYWLLVYDKTFDQTAVSFNATLVSGGDSCT